MAINVYQEDVLKCLDLPSTQRHTGYRQRITETRKYSHLRNKSQRILTFLSLKKNVQNQLIDYQNSQRLS